MYTDERPIDADRGRAVAQRRGNETRGVTEASGRREPAAARLGKPGGCGGGEESSGPVGTGSGHQDAPQRLLTAREAAAYLRISERKLWSMTSAGEVPHLRIGARVLYPERDLEAWIASKTRGGSEGVNQAC
jgi:excisionase family DNA binding protein